MPRQPQHPRCALYLHVCNLTATAVLRASLEPISGKKQAGTSTVNPQEIRPSQILIVWPFASKRVIEKNNSNKNLTVHIPTVASVCYFIRNVENHLGNLVPTGIAVIKKKKSQWSQRAFFINSTFYYKTPSFKQSVISNDTGHIFWFIYWIPCSSDLLIRDFPRLVGLITVLFNSSSFFIIRFLHTLSHYLFLLSELQST